MNPLLDIARKLKGSHCERLVKQTGTEIAVSGAGFAIANFKVGTDKFENKITEFYKVPPLMVALDTTQYLLCAQISQMKENSVFKEDCQKIRMQIILGFNMLSSYLCAPEPQKIEAQITEWLMQMNILTLESMEYLKPGAHLRKKAFNTNLSQIMEYQGLDVAKMQEALNILK